MERNALIIIAALGAAAVVLGATLGVVLLTPPAARTPSLSIDLWWPIAHYGTQTPDVASIIESNLEATGRIDVTLQSAEWATYIDQLGEMGFFILGWFPDYADADNYIAPFMGTAGGASLGVLYSDPLMDLAILEERTTFGAERTTVFAEIQRKMAEDALILPLFQGSQSVVYQDDVTGVTLEPIRPFKYGAIEKPGETTLKVGTIDRITTLDSADAYDYFSDLVVAHIFETLLDYEPGTANIVPLLAEEVPSQANGLVSADGLTYVFNIRSGVKFHDNTDVDAAAVKFSLDRARTLGGDPGFLLSDIIDTVDVTGPLQVTIGLKNAFTFFNALMAFSVSAVVSPTAYAADAFRTGLDPSLPPIGTGPYMLVGGDYQADQRVTLTRNDAYWDPANAAKSAKVQVNLVSDSTALKTQIETGQIHVAFRQLTPDDFLDLENRQAQLGLVTETGTGSEIRYLIFNHEMPPFDNVWVRRAIAAAVDRGQITSEVFLDLFFPLYSMVPDIFPEQTEAFKTVYGVGPDVDLANQYLDSYFASIETGLGQNIFADLVLPTREAS
ncbi:MAG: ABC transporter substrate-binding protein [Thermoplasmata archaeon]